MSTPAYHSRRREAAMQRWHRIAAMRRRGLTYADIGAALGVSGVTVFKQAQKLTDHQLNQTKP